MCLSPESVSIIKDVIVSIAAIVTASIAVFGITSWRRMLVGGQGLNEIAESLNLSRSTVANHHTHILHKLGVSGHVELTKLAIRHDIVEA